MLIFATLLLMLGMAYTQYRNGLFSAFAMLIMVLLSGLVAFGFWEPLADRIDPAFQNNALAGCEDMIVMVLLFSADFVLIASGDELSRHRNDRRTWAPAASGRRRGRHVTGYFLAGFLICAIETLPLDANFLDFEPRGVDSAGNLSRTDRGRLAFLLPPRPRLAGDDAASKRDFV